MRFGYADPPYLGCGKKHYGHQHDQAADYDQPETHRNLIGRLVDEFPDGWAMSLSSTTLHTILPMCPPDVRVGAWVKTFGAFKVNVNPAYVWEPVIFTGGRKRGRDVATVRDWVACPITLQRGTAGAKPDLFCFWLFELLGADPGDELVDLFPGSGAVAAAWQKWQSQPVLSAPAGVDVQDALEVAS